jgi:predicted SAM-dependent methyltransferase
MRLNLGCGTEIKPGYVNSDILRRGLNIVEWNLNTLPWPWGDNEAEEILAIDILEHLDNPVAFVDECWRILQPDGLLFIQTPRYDADFLWDDPTHKRGYTEKTMDFFDPDKPYGNVTYPYSDAKYHVECTTLPNKNLQFTMRAIK